MVYNSVAAPFLFLVNPRTQFSMLKQIKPGVFVVPEFLVASECSNLIDCSESAGFAAAEVRTESGSTAMPKIRNNDRVILSSNDVLVESWLALLAARVMALDLPELAGERPVGLPKDLRFYRYSPGQRFKMHKDGPWHEGGLTSRLTFLVYLNEEFSGGATDFRDLVVTPKMGMALIFEHATWHEGAAVTEGTKYVLRSDVMYDRLPIKLEAHRRCQSFLQTTAPHSWMTTLSQAPK